MFTSGVFDYADVLNKAADASWLRHQAIANNIANIDTPYYKRQDVDFESVLEYELRHFQYEPLDVKVKNVHLNRLDVSTYTDMENYSYRIDKNNVDVDQEASQLAKNQIKYQGLVNSMTQEFSRTKTAIGNGG
ncbi:MAG: flagellar basal body rod protein FlgB [Lachnospiraceae bacterium]|nr:flagellar basal body rod protein FlgB [Lachnospiraceae bacterium]